MVNENVILCWGGAGTIRDKCFFPGLSTVEPQFHSFLAVFLFFVFIQASAQTCRCKEFANDFIIVYNCILFDIHDSFGINIL